MVKSLSKQKGRNYLNKQDPACSCGILPHALGPGSQQHGFRSRRLAGAISSLRLFLSLRLRMREDSDNLCRLSKISLVILWCPIDPLLNVARLIDKVITVFLEKNCQTACRAPAEMNSTTLQ